MKNLRLSILPAVLLALCLVSCSKKDYVNVIPKDASFVMSADLKTIAEKADLENSSYMPIVSEFMSELVGSNEQVQSYMKDPKKTGIDFRQPLYVFMAGDVLGVTMAVYDKGDVEKTLAAGKSSGLYGGMTETDGISMATLDRRGIVAFNKSTLLILANTSANSADALKPLCKQLFGLDKDLRFAESDAYNKMNDLEGELQFYSDIAMLPGNIINDLKPLMPEGVRYSDVEAYSSVSFLNGKVVWKGSMGGKTKDAAKLIKKGNKKLKKIDGEYIDSPMQDFLVWACFGVEKGGLLDMAKQTADGKQMLLMLERAIDIEQMMKQVEGDVSFVCAAIDDETEYMIMAEIDDDDFLKDVDYWQRSMKDYGMSMTKTIGDNYLLNAGDYAVNWGVDDDNLYFASPAMFAKNSVSQRSTLLQPLKADIKSSLFYAYINMEVASQYGEPSMVRKVTDKMKSLIIQVKSPDSMEITLNMKDDSQNVLKELMN